MAQVTLILQEAVPSLGEVGDLVTVKPGFARNYLIPQGKAIFATDARVEELEHHKRVVAEKAAKQLQDLQAVKTRVEALSVTISARVGEEGKLFGPVTNADIGARLAERNFQVDRRKTELSEPIKQVGEYEVTVKLHREVRAQIRVNVFGDGAPPAPVEEVPEAPEEPAEAAVSDDGAQEDPPV